MAKRYGWAIALVALSLPLAVPETALAIDATTCGYNQGPGGWYKATDRSGPYSLDSNCNATLIGSGSGGGSGTGGTGGTVTQGPAAADNASNRWPTVAYQGGTWAFGLSGPIPTGSNVIGAVTQSGGPWSVSGQVTATLNQGGNALSAGNPIFAQVTNLPSTTQVAGTVSVGNFPATQPVSGAVSQGAGGSSAWKVDGSGVTQPVSGAVSVSNLPATQAISAAALPLPSGAATAANQNVTAAGTTASNAQAVQGVTNGVPLPVSGTVTANQGTSPWAVSGPVSQSGSWVVGQGAPGGSAWRVDGSGVTQPVSAASLPLPAGAATSAAQTNVQSAAGTSAGTLLSVQGSVNGVPIPISGTVSVSNQTVSQSVTNAGTFAVQNTAPVVGGNSAAVKVDGSGVTQPVSGTVAVSNYPASQAVSNAGTFAVQNTAALPAGTNVVGSTTLRLAGTNRSASVTTTASTLMAANAVRVGWKIKNDCGVAVWINFDGTAAATPGSGNMQVPSGGYVSSEQGYVETGAMSVVAASGTCALTAREY